jgi:broad specificity phosphatase PhoE
MFDRLPCLLLIPHADAGDRRKWPTDQDLRPLSELGVAQAAALADEVGHVDEIISSPALRCVQTVEPIAERSGIDVKHSDDLREIGFADEVERWDTWELDESWRAQLVASSALGRASRVVRGLRALEAGRRVVVSAHGDLIPLLAMFAAGFFRVPAPPPVARGGCYLIEPSNPTSPISTLGALAPLPS